MSWIGPQIPSFAEIESFLTPLSQEVQGAFEDCHTVDHLVAAHNRYSAWLALFVYSVLGHRPVLDPMCHLDSAGAGVAVIEDKVTSERHRYRLVPVPSQLETQLKVYESHLASLSTLLLRGLSKPEIARPLGATIYARASGSAPNLPRIILLTCRNEEAATIGIRPKAVKELTQWPWELNLGRRLIHTWIVPGGSEWIPQKVPDPALKALLGHRGIGEGGLNDTEHWVSPSQYIQTTRAALDALADLQGWVPLPGLAHSIPKRCNAPARGIARARHLGGLGPDVRAAERDRAKQHARALARELVSEVVPEGTDRISHIQLEDLYGELDRLKSAYGVATVYHARNLLTRLARYQNRKSVGRLVLAEFVAGHESPYSRDWPARLARSLTLEETFRSELHSRGRRAAEAPSQARRIAEVVVAAALYEGLAQAQHLRTLAGSLLEQTVRRSGYLIYVDLKDKNDRLLQRVVPSQITRALLLGLMRRYSEPVCQKKEVDRELRSLLETLGLAGKRDPYSTLAAIGVTVAIWRLPPFLMRVRMGKSVHQPLHPTALHRLVTGRALAKSHNTQQEAVPQSSNGHLPDIPLGIEKAEMRGADEFLRLLREALAAAQTRPANGSKRLSPPAARKEIQRRVRDLCAACPWLPPIALAVAQWTVYLARYGTFTKRKLKPATVVRYVLTVARSLAKVGWHHDYHAMTESDHEDLYRNALSIPRSDTEIAFLAKRLREYHAAHCDMHGLDPVDWTGFPSAAPDQGLRYSTIVTASDYEATIDALLQDPHHGERKRLSHALMVLLGYRFGLRAGEAATLRVQDLILDPESGRVGVSVRPSMFRGLKSVASSRMATCFEPLTKDEIHMLQRAIELANIHADRHSGNPPLFLNPERPDQLLRRGPMIDRIHEALRQATGDPRVRYHTLRHSFITYASALVLPRPFRNQLSFLPGLDEGVAAGARRWLADGCGTGYGQFRSVARVVGHADCETTMANYAHLIECAAHDISCPELTSYAQAYATAIDSRALRQRKSRNGTYESASDLDCIAEPSGSYTTERQVRMSPVPAARAVTLAIIHDLTARSRTGETIENMARIADLDVEQVRMVLDAGRRVTQLSGYPGVPHTALELKVMTGEPSGTVEVKKRRSKLLSGTLREWDGVLPSLEIQESDILISGIYRWLIGYNNSFDTPTFHTLEELRDFTVMFRVLGVGVWRHALKVNSKSNLSPEVLEWVRDQGLSISEGNSHPTNAIAWAANRKKGCVNNADFQAAMYSLCVYAMIKWRIP